MSIILNSQVAENGVTYLSAMNPLMVIQVRILSWLQKGFLQQENIQNRNPQGCVGSSPTEEATPDGEIGRRTGQKRKPAFGSVAQW